MVNCLRTLLLLEYATCLWACANGANGPDSSTGTTDATTAQADAPADTGMQAPSGSFLERDGLVVVEIESEPVAGSWVEESSISEASGTYYRWASGGGISGSGQGTLSYPIHIARGGRYELYLRSAAPHATDENDVFVRVVGAPTRVMRAAETPGPPCPGEERERNPLADAEGWFKIYQNRSGDAWSFDTHHVDSCPHWVFVDIPADTTIRVEWSGRSSNFKIDRFVLRHFEDVEEPYALDVARPESERAP